ncbi:hypothetical protein DPMN_061762 [Dreissena polymorpha]|uniref:Uncharacterized protein n=1 Tax=Dreissena polymorpha TaxID=45954 RepID=A0A9D4C8B9_DREPO|nr:hypothetical protein DPMN_061762 [Dreissena polymorpha]
MEWVGLGRAYEMTINLHLPIYEGTKCMCVSVSVQGLNALTKCRCVKCGTKCMCSAQGLMHVLKSVHREVIKGKWPASHSPRGWSVARRFGALEHENAPLSVGVSPLSCAKGDNCGPKSQSLEVNAVYPMAQY